MAENTPSTVAPRKITSSVRRFTNRCIGQYRRVLRAGQDRSLRSGHWSHRSSQETEDYHWPVPVLSIDDPGDLRLADYRGIPDSELARARGGFVAEGRLVVRRLLTSRFATRSVMVTPAALDAVAA